MAGSLQTYNLTISQNPAIIAPRPFWLVNSGLGIMASPDKNLLSGQAESNGHVSQKTKK